MNVLIFSDVNGVLGHGRYGGAYKVATELRDAGFSVQVVEFFADLTLAQIEAIAEKFVDRETLMVGFATTLMIRKTDGAALERTERTKHNRYTGHLPQDDQFVQEMFEIFRRRNPSVAIVVGGGKSSPTTLQGVDYWVWGYADASIVALARHLSSNQPLKTRPGDVGLVISAEDYPYNDFVRSAIRWRPEDLVVPGEHLPIEIDRGCIFRCTFCANTLFKDFGQFNKDASALRDEVLRNYEHAGTVGYMFCDDTVNDSQAKVDRLRSAFSDLPFELEWTGFGRVDVIYGHRQQREQLRETGVRALLFGIETLHPVAAKGIGKGLHPEKVKETLHFLRESWKGEVTMTGSFIVGLPGEPEGSVWETVEWLTQDDCPLDNGIFSPLNIRASTENPNAPMSRIQRAPKEFGYEVSGPAPGTGISTEGPYWKNEFMDKTRAMKIVDEVHEKYLGSPPVADWAVYSRLRSLGYSHEDIAGRRGTDSAFIEDVNSRKQAVRSSYLESLLR